MKDEVRRLASTAVTGALCRLARICGTAAERLSARRIRGAVGGLGAS